MLNPPWALPFVALLGSTAIPDGAFCLAGKLPWSLERSPPSPYGGTLAARRAEQWIGLVLFVTFLPLGSAEHMGQITLLVWRG